MRHEIGVSRFMFGMDYPHPEGTWPTERILTPSPGSRRTRPGSSSARTRWMLRPRPGQAGRRRRADRPDASRLLGAADAVDERVLENFQRVRLPPASRERGPGVLRGDDRRGRSRPGDAVVDVAGGSGTAGGDADRRVPGAERLRVHRAHGRGRRRRRRPLTPVVGSSVADEFGSPQRLETSAGSTGAASCRRPSAVRSAGPVGAPPPPVAAPCPGGRRDGRAQARHPTRVRPGGGRDRPGHQHGRVPVRRRAGPVPDPHRRGQRLWRRLGRKLVPSGSPTTTAVPPARIRRRAPVDRGPSRLRRPGPLSARPRCCSPVSRRRVWPSSPIPGRCATTTSSLAGLPHYFSAGACEPDPARRHLRRRTGEAGLPREERQVGLVRTDAPSYHGRPTRSSSRHLAHWGSSSTEEALVPPTYSLTDAGATSAQAQNAVLRFRVPTSTT